MINWEILGIPPTSDTSAIKKAYRSRLAQTNPEDKPEEFMELRQAYEEALARAREMASSAQTSGPDTASPVSALDADLLPPGHPALNWTKKLQRLYRSFHQRIEPENWQQLCADPVCTRIDTRGDVQDALLRFLMEWWFLPDEAIRVLDRTFGFEAQQEALMERYPQEFVEAILLAPLHRQGTSLDYHLFEGAPDADYDGFINGYYTLTGLVNHREQKEAWDLLSQMETSGIFHPLLQVEKAKLCLAEENLSLAAAAMESVYPAFDTSAAVCCMAGEIALIEEDYPKALECFSRALEVLPSSDWARLGLAETSLKLKQYEEARKWVDEVLTEDRYNSRGQALEEAIQNECRESLLQKLADGEASEKDRFDLAVICIDTGEFETACELLSAFQPEGKKEEAERRHYLATALLSLEKPEDALREFHLAAEILRSLAPVTAAKSELAALQQNLARTCVMESVALEQLNRCEDALELITNITLDYPNLHIPFCRKAELHYELKQYEAAIDAATRSLELDSGFHLPYRIRANACYELGYYNEAYQDCNDCIALFGGDIEAFFCRINILTEAGEFEMAFRELDDLEEQVRGTQITFLRGKALEASGDLEQARLTYRRVMDEFADKDRDLYPPAEVHSLAGTFYRLVQVCRGLYQKTQQKSYWKEFMDLLQTGVRKFPADLDLMGDLAGEFYGQSHHKEAQMLYERLAELDPYGARYAQLAGNEIQMDRFDAALSHLDTAQAMDSSLVYAEILRAAIHTCRENYDQALDHLDRAQVLSQQQDRSWPRILRDKAMIYSRRKEYDKAIACFRENWDLYRDPDDYSSILEMYRLSGRFREALAEGKSFLASCSPEERLEILDEMKLSASCLGDWDLVEYYCARDPRSYNRNFFAGRHLMYSNIPGEDAASQALHCFLQACEADPSSIHSLVETAKLYLRKKDRKKACEFAEKALASVPADFMDSGYQRAYYLTRSAEALAILGKYDEAMERIQLALKGRKCDFCRYSGCIDAYCALVYMCCIRGDEAGAANCRSEGLQLCPYDRDLLLCPDYFLKKRGLFT